ncbi:zinc finger protein 569-like isoform X2 [Pollicipes pollicipes]|uniref:zinc finger protein 569-like isoform X2 n=1 Tax=Pollicipes pollicipes TaxID=41117 RepID=UPI001884A666|nr:zinc finger protein 569-like isoform X2 [Pollicipes pollicipes]
MSRVVRIRKPTRTCFVPDCTNSLVSTPHKRFFAVPRDLEIRRRWARAARRSDAADLTSRGRWHCCEDHFKEEDYSNLMMIQLMGLTQRLNLKKGAIPSKFECQDSQLQQQHLPLRKQQIPLVEHAVEDHIIKADSPTASTQASNEGAVPMAWDIKGSDRHADFSDEHTDNNEPADADMDDTVSFSAEGHPRLKTEYCESVSQERFEDMPDFVLPDDPLAIKSEPADPLATDWPDRDVASVSETAEEPANMKCEWPEPSISVKIEPSEDEDSCAEGGLTSDRDPLVHAKSEQAPLVDTVKHEPACVAEGKTFVCMWDKTSVIRSGHPCPQCSNQSERGPFTCGECGRVFQRRVCRDVHALIHPGKPSETVCGQTFSRGIHRVKHVRAHMAARAASCEMCRTDTGTGADYSHQCECCEESLNILRGPIEGAPALPDPSMRSLSIKDMGDEDSLRCPIPKRAAGVYGASHACNICGMKHFDRKPLAAHIRRHYWETPYGCAPCLWLFPTLQDLRRHFGTRTTVNKALCVICGKRLGDVGALERHVQQHRDARLASEACSREAGSLETGPREASSRAVCLACGEEFPRSVGLDRHVRVASGETAFTCEGCGRSFADRSGLYDHYWAHLGRARLHCGGCAASFARAGGLTGHVRRHVRQTPFTCVKCGKACADQRQLAHHVLIHRGTKPFECSLCGLAFKFRSNMEAHSLSHGDQKVQCGICGMSFADGKRLAMHVRAHKTRPKRWACDKCGTKFTSSTLLDSHLQRAAANEALHKCRKCARPFCTRRALADHAEVHRGGRGEFKCQVCGLVCRGKGGLAKHTRTHEANASLGGNADGNGGHRNVRHRKRAVGLSLTHV